MNHKNKAFTLIELLVVIAIIAILAAILFPVFAQAKLAAKKTTAISNVKNINLGLIIYEGDYDDMTPNLWAIGIPQPYTLPVELSPYIQKVNNQAAGVNTGNTSGIWADPGDPIAPKNDGSVERKSWFRTVPLNKISNGAVVKIVGRF